MIPILNKAEPANFNRKVRLPGQVFLSTTPNPTYRQWTRKNYWTLCLPELITAYDHICAYCAIRIAPSSGGFSVDHYIPKSVNAKQAYEWSNFRLASRRFNSKKHTKILMDPFAVQQDWFIIDFDTYFIKPNIDLLNGSVLELANYTIKELHLNIDNDLVQERIHYIMLYATKEFTFNTLRYYAPFIAYELERQDLKESIKLRIF